MIETAELEALHDAVERALAARDDSGLSIVGWGEISLGVGWPTGSPRFVAKRLPPFADRPALERYGELIGDYVSRLTACGVRVAPTELAGVDLADGRVVGYGIQELLPAEALATRVLADADPAAGTHPLITRVCDLTAEVVSPQLGFDAQLSNWAWVAGEPVYFDVTTPLIRDEAGETLLDMGFLLAAYPAIARPPLARFVAPGIVARYHDLRSVLRDIAANLIKERLEEWMPAVIEASAQHLGEPLSEREIRRDYRSDAAMWKWVQRIRRADRGWHRLTGRTYPFLIPKQIER